MDGEQADLFGASAATDYSPDPAKVRAQLRGIIAEARSATILPWEHRRLALYRIIVPQMASWLPSDERQQLCFEFETELARLEAA